MAALTLLASGAVGTGETNALLTAWLAAQTNFHSWSAEVLQTRTLKALAQPLTARGRVWFVTPDRFRWELGEPAQTIAVRQPEQMLVIYPKLKRAERYPLSGERHGPWRDALVLLESGFPRSQADLEAKFRVLGVTSVGDVCQVTLQPRAAGARKMMPRLRVGFTTNDFALRATELTFADGSTLRNDFTNALVNPKVDEALFAPVLNPEIKIVEPLAEHGGGARGEAPR
ncbi:MAG: outer membrane lipoprotein carrier protein LolA [Verrucomicrobia bacterium]|nr:outer membrane lipoprotein carrier protein LolA [Verrucomicrobiota bacterium]